MNSSQDQDASASISNSGDTGANLQLLSPLFLSRLSNYVEHQSLNQSLGPPQTKEAWTGSKGTAVHPSHPALPLALIKTPVVTWSILRQAH